MTSEKNHKIGATLLASCWYEKTTAMITFLEMYNLNLAVVFTGPFPPDRVYINLGHKLYRFIYKISVLAST